MVIAGGDDTEAVRALPALDPPHAPATTDHIFEASIRAAQALRGAHDGTAPWVYPLSQGYALLVADDVPERVDAGIHVALDHGRTLVLTNPGDHPVEVRWPEAPPASRTIAMTSAAGAASVLDGPPHCIDPGATCFVLTRAGRRAGIAHSFDAPAPAPTPVPADGTGQAGFALTILGLGPGGDAPLSLRATLAEAEHVVVFDRIHDRALAGIAVPGTVHVVPYVYADFDQSVRMIAEIVDGLQAAGAQTVAVAVEGNPEVFDLAPRLAHHTRHVDVVPSRPIALRGLDRVGVLLGRPLIESSYALLSGIPRRHPARRRGLRRELNEYLRAGLGCVLIEMYAGDRALLADTLASLDPVRMVAVMTDLFSAGEHIEVFESSALRSGAMPFTASGRGHLVSVGISGAEVGDIGDAGAAGPPRLRAVR